ncbi:MAG: hypothetical protein R2815_13035 [Flavobacteriales bacterium]|nr:hypothetical protein [Flavobacteriales bacterium]
MKYTVLQNTVTMLALVITIFGCTKEEELLPDLLDPGAGECGSEGARLQADVQGSAFCASAQLIAMGGSGSLMVTGIDALGTTLILQFDSLAIGQQVIGETENSLLYMHLGSSYVPTGEAGVLEITALDTVSRNIKAHFTATLMNEGNGSTRTVDGSLEVGWTPE